MVVWLAYLQKFTTYFPGLAKTTPSPQCSVLHLRSCWRNEPDNSTLDDLGIKYDRGIISKISIFLEGSEVLCMFNK